MSKKKVRVLVLIDCDFPEVFVGLRKIEAAKMGQATVNRTYKASPNSLCLHGDAVEYLVPNKLADKIKGVGNRTGWLGTPDFVLTDGSFICKSPYEFKRYSPEYKW